MNRHSLLSSLWRRRTLLAPLFAMLCLPALLPAQVVISQVYGGGGNSGATYKNDFIELFNAGGSAVDLSAWSVQYASAAGASWSLTKLTGSIQAGGYYLVQEAAGTGGTTSLPTPDATGTLALSGTAGKVALVASQTALSASATCAAWVAGSVDFVGFGTTATCYEGTGPTPAPSNTTAVLRAGAGCTDTNVNSADFAAGSPAPRNSSTATHTCTAALSITNTSSLVNGAVFQPYSVTFAATGGSGSGYTFQKTSGTLPPGLTLSGAVLSGSPTTTTGSPFSFTIQVTDSALSTASASFTLVIDPMPTCTQTASIAAIQGSGNTSPLTGSTVTTTGIVTGLKSSGFFIQMPAPGDSDPSTSDGVFVYTSSAPPASAVVGNSVCVTGKVQEYVPSSDPYSPSQTEIGSPTVSVLSIGNTLPDPVVLTASDTNPAGALLQLEKYEGMRVQVGSLTVTGPTDGTVNESAATSTSNGIFYGVITGVARPFREAGVQLPDSLPSGSPCCVPRWDTNPEILAVNSLGQTGGTAIDVATGAVVANLTGPLEYTYRAYQIDVDPGTTPTVTNNARTFTAVPAPLTSEVTVSSFNMERFFDTTDDPNTSDAVLTTAAFQNRLNKASLVIRNVLRYPDVLGVEEVENLTTLQAIAKKVNDDAVAAGDVSPNYQASLSEGNDVGGIDVGFLVKGTKVSNVTVTQEGKDTTFIEPSGSSALLNDRPPLVLTATVTRDGSDQPLPLTVIVNHLRSLSSIDDATDGARVRKKRELQAEYLANLIQTRQSANSKENIVSIGDYNAYQFNDGYVDVIGVVKGTPADSTQVVTPGVAITSPALTDLVDTLAASEQYSYTYSGSAQALDHILVNPNLLARLSRFAYARVDADFPEVYRNDPNRPERISDHDIPVAYFTMPLNHTPTPVNQSQNVTYNTATTFALSGGDPDTGDTLTFATTVAPAKGGVTYNGSARTATYTPTTGATGTDTFTYSSTDQGGLSKTATVTITIVPADVTAATSVTGSGLSYNRPAKLYIGTITVKNTSSQAIAGPVQLVLKDLPTGITLANATGTTPSGYPYLTVNTGGLSAGQSATVAVQYSDPVGIQVSATRLVYSGAL